MIPFLSQDTPEKKKGKEVAYFVPKTARGPFQKLDLMGTNNLKCLAVDMSDKTLTIKKSEDTKLSYTSFVIE